MSDYTPDSISENEPSMEDILASIRKIIADDTPSANAGSVSELEVAKPVTDFAIDPLDLTETAAPATPSDALDTLDFDLETEADVLDLTESLLEVPADPASTASATDFDEDFDLVLGEDDNDDALDIDALFNGDDEEALTSEPAAIVSDDDILDLDALLDSDFDETEFDLDIPAEPERVIDPAEALLASEDVAVTDAVAVDLSNDDLIDDMLGDMDLTDIDDSSSEITATSAVLGAGALAGAAGLASKTTGATTGGDADIDLVKSLMAELTEDEDFETEALDSSDDDDLIVPELDDAATDLSDEIDLEDLLSATDDDVLSDVTGIAATSAEPLADANLNGESLAGASDDLADIVAQSNADIEAAKLETETIDAQGITPLSIYDDAPDEDITEDMPMPEITAGDDAADDKDRNLAAFAAAAAGSAVIATGASLSKAQGEDEILDLADIVPDLEDAPTNEVSAEMTSQADTELTTETTQNTTDLTEDNDMPRIVKSDTIAADETVEAASGAFASLSQVVEEKAVYTESGPRIGELVQEALKPMLQEWLDKNLKGIVDRAVAKEIKRISSGK